MKNGFTSEKFALSVPKPALLMADATESECFLEKQIYDYGVDYDNDQLVGVSWYCYPSMQPSGEAPENIYHSTVARYCLRSELPVPGRSLRGPDKRPDN